MTLTTIILVILLGILVILAEIFLIPGTTVAGIVGVLIIGIGIWCAFYFLDTTTGYWVFGCTVAVVVGLGILGFRSRTWKMFEVKGAIHGKAPLITASVAEGTEGITLTRCAPIGKAEFGNELEEVYSDGDYIEAGVKVKIAQIRENKIFIKPITT